MVVQSEGLEFYRTQTRSNAIIFHNTLLAMCMEKVVVMKPEGLYLKTYQFFYTAKSCTEAELEL